MNSGTTAAKSERILASIRQIQRSKEVVDVEQELVKLVIFEINGALYALYGRNVREVLPRMDISWVPGLPDFLPGLINVRGDIESVIDLRQLLHYPHLELKDARILMVENEGFRSGVLIDDIRDVLDLPHNVIKPPLMTLNGVARELVAGEFELGGHLVSLLDTDKLAIRAQL